jgi:Zn-finger nucleic acid-binding protein
MFDGTAFCPTCGAARPVLGTHASGARCPGCRGELTVVEGSAVAMLECGACDGVWLDQSAFEQVCTNSEARAAILQGVAVPLRPATEPHVKYRPCVRCGKMMNRVNFAKLSGTIVDVCRGHGTFLDAGELQALVAFIHDGGLDRMRQHDIQQLQGENRRLEAARNQSSHVRIDLDSAEDRWDVTSLSEMMKAIFGR